MDKVRDNKLSLPLPRRIDLHQEHLGVTMVTGPFNISPIL